MKKRSFLAPLALAVAALSTSVATQDKALIAEASPTIAPHQSTSSVDAAKPNDERILEDFVLKRDENNVLMAEHYSHSSHASHRSHYSSYH